MKLKDIWQKAVATWNKVLAVWDVLVTIYYKVTFRDRWYIKYCWVEGDVKKRFKTNMCKHGWESKKLKFSYSSFASKD